MKWTLLIPAAWLMAKCSCTEPASSYYFSGFTQGSRAACVLEILLQKRGGIEKVRTVPDIASIVIHFDPISYRKQSCSLFWMRYWQIWAKKPTASHNSSQLVPTDGDVSLAEQEFNLTIDGWAAYPVHFWSKCYEEDSRISSANVNYATETATVTGRPVKKVCACWSAIWVTRRTALTVWLSVKLWSCAKRNAWLTHAACRSSHNAEFARHDYQYGRTLIQDVALGATYTRHAYRALAGGRSLKSHKTGPATRYQYGQLDCFRVERLMVIASVPPGR